MSASTYLHHLFGHAWKERRMLCCRGPSITSLSNVLKFSTAATCPHVHVRSAGEDDNDGWQKFNLQAVQHFGSGPRTKKQAGETQDNAAIAAAMPGRSHYQPQRRVQNFDELK